MKAWLVLQLSGTFRDLNTAEMPQSSLKGRCRWIDTSLGPISSGKKSGRLVSMLCMRFVSYILLAVSKRPVPLASPHCRKTVYLGHGFSKGLGGNFSLSCASAKRCNEHRRTGALCCRCF